MNKLFGLMTLDFIWKITWWFQVMISIQEVSKSLCPVLSCTHFFKAPASCYVGNCGRSALLSFRAFSLTWPSAMQIQLPQHWFGTPIWPPWRHMKTLSLTWPRAIQIYWNKRKLLHKIKFQPLEDWFGTPTWPAVSLFWDTNMADVTSLENAVLFRNRFISRFLAINYSWELALVDFICYLLPLPSRK